MFKKHYFEHKGYGYIATVDIPHDTLVLEEFISDDLIDDGLNMLEQIYILITKYKEEFDKLSPLYIDEGIKSIDHYFRTQFGKMKSNTLQWIQNNISVDDFRLYCEKYNRNVFCFEMPNGKYKYTVVFNASIFNNSCDPNISYYTDSTNKKICFVAIKDIKVGEELSISYLHYVKGTCLRKQFLKDTYNFDCQCEKCKICHSYKCITNKIFTYCIILIFLLYIFFFHF